ncbi:glyoxalase, partial [Streptomyces sp. NPDC046805]|uniref:glyoxalase n=1 Tax=Streptomyces sp. NPDC046805 TaxID=3155134 RepID=UPI0033FBB305
RPACPKPFGAHDRARVLTAGLTPAQSLGTVPDGIRLTTRDADADHAALRARGVDADAKVARMGPAVPPMFAVRDPDGNNLILIESS